MLKRYLLSTTALPVSDIDRHIAVRAAWRLAFGVMQPWSENDNPNLGCNCPSPDLLLEDCNWHGREARRMIA